MNPQSDWDGKLIYAGRKHLSLTPQHNTSRKILNLETGEAQCVNKKLSKAATLELKPKNQEVKKHLNHENGALVGILNESVASSNYQFLSDVLLKLFESFHCDEVAFQAFNNMQMHYDTMKDGVSVRSKVGV
ncbi:unnamed protein product [Sphenostylis stenocarpa]|uniref:Uncharacterized protein n=1 Tax=Sphenostylis stenocarpa TaxID=92480 RepID=A0AA86T334_9FABA|nr:unnamed protein product [Sphenostylis stenocarpa]